MNTWRHWNNLKPLQSRIWFTDTYTYKNWDPQCLYDYSWQALWVHEKQIWMYLSVHACLSNYNTHKYALFCGCHLNLSNHDCFRRHTVKVYVDFINNWNGSVEQIITQIGANKTGDLWLWNWDCFHSLTWCIVECLMWYNLMNQALCWDSCE